MLDFLQETIDFAIVRAEQISFWRCHGANMLNSGPFNETSNFAPLFPDIYKTGSIPESEVFYKTLYENSSNWREEVIAWALAEGDVIDDFRLYILSQIGLSSIDPGNSDCWKVFDLLREDLHKRWNANHD